MYNNLMIEMVKKGYKAKDVAHMLASLLNCSEDIIKNKLKNIGEFTFQEVMKINKKIFNDEMDIKYLFANEQHRKTTYQDKIIHRSKPSKCWN